MKCCHRICYSYFSRIFDVCDEGMGIFDLLTLPLLFFIMSVDIGFYLFAGDDPVSPSEHDTPA